MALGMVLCASAFIIAGVLQINIDEVAGVPVAPTGAALYRVWPLFRALLSRFFVLRPFPGSSQTIAVRVLLHFHALCCHFPR